MKTLFPLPSASCLSVLALALGSFLTVTLGAEDPPLIVHEWGTFTSLQDETGRSIPGINSDDEPVPDFVHRVARMLVHDAAALPFLFKGLPGSHPDVTMRLETPVIYFHPSPGSGPPPRIDVQVDFLGGWITEYYPDGEARAPGLAGRGGSFGRLRPDTVGSLRWEDLVIGSRGDGPQTDERVWLEPRQVEAASVRSRTGEIERFLFYRGVGNLESPVRVSRNPEADRIVIEARFSAERSPVFVDKLWLLDTRVDGSSAFRELPPLVAVGGKAARVETPAGFEESDYDPSHHQLLREEMLKALVVDGLYPDEAQAMLDTWEVSYFRSPGTRLFFLVPRSWTDAVLPLRFSVATQLERVMVGRIEIVSPRQRELLRLLAEGPGATDLGISDLIAFDELGRFRHALLLDEFRRGPTEGLGDFLRALSLRYYEPSPE